MVITFGPAKRDRALSERGLDFLAAEQVLAGPSSSFEDRRFDYDETRIITVGYLNGRMMLVVWTPRGADRHVISMGKTNDREQVRYAPLLR